MRCRVTRRFTRQRTICKRDKHDEISLKLSIPFRSTQVVNLISFCTVLYSIEDTTVLMVIPIVTVPWRGFITDYNSLIVGNSAYRVRYVIFHHFNEREQTLNERTDDRKLIYAVPSIRNSGTCINEPSEYLAVRGIPNDSFFPLDRNIAIYGNCLYMGTEQKHGEVKNNATASVPDACLAHW